MAMQVRSTELILVRDGGSLELDLALLQGLWTEQQYLKLTDQINSLIEFADGVIEILPMPTDKHQAISQFLFLALLAFIRPLGGKVQYAPLRLQIREGKFREPDLLLMLDAADVRRQNSFWLGADLVVEVVSPDDQERDTKVKRAEYAQAGIPEYWIINPEDETVTVLALAGGSYIEHGVFLRDQVADSLLLPGFAVDVSELLNTI